MFCIVFEADWQSDTIALALFYNISYLPETVAKDQSSYSCGKILLEIKHYFDSFLSRGYTVDFCCDFTRVSSFER